MNLNFPNPEDTIGNNLSALNFAFETLDIEVSQIQKQINESILPFIAFWIDNEGGWMSAVTAVPTLSAIWNSVYANVQMNSAAWLTPIFTFYPSTVSAKSIHTLDISGDIIDTQFILKTIPTWLNNNYPIFEANGKIKYVENQLIYVQFFVYEVTDVNNSIILNYTYPFTDSYICQGQIQGNPTTGSDGNNAYATLDCSTDYSNATWWWAGSLLEGTCNCDHIRALGTLHCQRAGVPASCSFYVNGAWRGAYISSINAILSLQRDPWHQDLGTRMVPYIVKNCEWVPKN